MKIQRHLEFLRKTQKLKAVVRHSWTEDKTRQESTAEHSWHMSLMAMAFYGKLNRKVNLEKVLQLITIHDLAEALTGDVPAWLDSRTNKFEQEERAMGEILKTLPQKAHEELKALWLEYEERKTAEARFVKMLDLIDVYFQHLMADISTWHEKEWKINLEISPKSQALLEEEPFIFDLYQGIHEELVKKMENAKKG